LRDRKPALRGWRPSASLSKLMASRTAFSLTWSGRGSCVEEREIRDGRDGKFGRGGKWVRRRKYRAPQRPQPSPSLSFSHLHEDAIDARVPVELLDDGDNVGLGGVSRQVPAEVDDACLGAGLLLHAHVRRAVRAAPDENDGEARGLEQGKGEGGKGGGTNKNV
jgi:hypothetical protein